MNTSSVDESGARAKSASPTGTKTDLEFILEDWSGRGAHVDFKPSEQVPLEEGRCLGYGSMGPVYETTIRGHAFAWKRRYCRYRIGDAERKELEILKKVSHHHIIRLVGSYTYQQFLGLLLYPVAFYDLATLLEDMEAVVDEDTAMMPSQYERLKRFCDTDLRFHDPEDQARYGFDYNRQFIGDFLKPFILSKIGCVISAVECLHSQRIRHKDLKPSNILISREGLWLTDFGTATDFSQQTISVTENGERGTPKYFAPETAAYQPSGRAADIFSLGCVVLEMYMAVQDGMSKKLKQLRSAKDKSFHANLDPVLNWLYPTSWTSGDTDPWAWKHFGAYMRRHIATMLAKEPTERPEIATVRTNMAKIDTLEVRQNGFPYFGDCCRRPFISPEEHDKKMFEARQAHQVEIDALKAEYASKVEDLHIAFAAQAEKEKEELVRNYEFEIADLHMKNRSLQRIVEDEKQMSVDTTCERPASMIAAMNTISFDRWKKEHKERKEAHLYMDLAVASEENFKLHQGFDIVPWEAETESPANPRVYRVLRTTTVAEFAKTVAEDLGTEPDLIQPWTIVNRMNGTMRPEARISLDMAIEKLSSNFGPNTGPIKMWIEKAIGRDKDGVPEFGDSNRRFPALPRERSIMLFLKHFDAKRQSLFGIGNFYAASLDRVGDLCPQICKMMGWPSSMPLMLSEEITPKKIERMRSRITLSHSEIQNGDIIIVQRLSMEQEASHVKLDGN
jgi:serine/threonine protein kinase